MPALLSRALFHAVFVYNLCEDISLVKYMGFIQYCTSSCSSSICQTCSEVILIVETVVEKFLFVSICVLGEYQALLDLFISEVQPSGKRFGMSLHSSGEKEGVIHD